MNDPLTPSLTKKIVICSDGTGNTTVKGRGTSLGRMSADVSLQVDSSRYQRYTARSLAAVLSVRHDSVRASAQGDFVQSAIDFTASMSLARDSVTGFNVLLRSNALDLGRVLGDDSLASDLNFVLSATGAIYLILELGLPFSGLLMIPSYPLAHALPPL